MTDVLLSAASLRQAVASRRNTVSEAEWNDWRWQVRKSLRTLKDLESWVNLTEDEREAVAKAGGRLKIAIPPYFAELMDPEDPACPIRRQAIPTMDELKLSSCEVDDPLGEDGDMVAPGLVHRYPDRVLFLVTDVCPMYCRYCTRARLVGAKGQLEVDEREQAYDYLRKNKKVRDVLISGGDPLMLTDEKLEDIIANLRAIPHIEIIRLGTRFPSVLPQRVTPQLVAMLKKHHPIWMNIHFSHPKEVTPEAMAATSLLVEAGIPLGSQTVLLKGINDTPAVMRSLMHKLVMARVRPYYIYQCDLIKGAEHFRTAVSTGVRIMEALRGHTSGYAVPTYVIDAPGGGGKVPIAPEYVLDKDREGVIFRNYENKVFRYPDAGRRRGTRDSGARWAGAGELNQAEASRYFSARNGVGKEVKSHG